MGKPLNEERGRPMRTTTTRVLLRPDPTKKEEEQPNVEMER